MHINFLWRWLVLGLLVGCSPVTSLLHPSSPCPSVFSYDGAGPETDRWYGEIVVNSAEYLVGVRLNIQLDRQSHLMVSWLGEVTTSNNKEFTILNLEQVLDPSRPMTTRIMVRFEPNGGSPKVKTIWLNGKQICPAETPIQANALTKNKTKPASSGLKRPDPIFITDTLYNGSVTTNDDYYNEFFNINQQNAMKQNPDKVYANTESSVLEPGGYSKPQQRPQKPPRKKGQTESVDNTYTIPSSNTEYNAGQNEQSSYNQGTIDKPLTSPVYNKKPQEPEYQAKPQTYPAPDNSYNSYSNTDAYGSNGRPQTVTNSETSHARPQKSPESSYNTRPQTNSDSNYNSRPQTNPDNVYYVKPQTETSYNTRPQTNPEPSYNTRPQSNSDSNYNSRPQTNPEPSYNTRPQSSPDTSYNTRPQSSPDTSYNTRPQSNSDTSYNTRPQSNSDTRPQTTSDSNYNSRPQTNPEPSYNSRPQTNPEPSYNTRPQTNPEPSYNTRPQTNPEPSYTKPQTNYQNNYDTMPSAGNSYTGNRPQTISESSYNTKPQQTYEESYRPQGNVGGSGGYQSGNVGYNSNTGYNTQPQPTVNTGYSTSSSNSRPVVYQGQKPSSQSEISYNGKKPSQNSNTPDIGDIAEHLIDDGDSNNKTVIITVIKHNAQETTTENYKTTTWKPKTTAKPNNKDKDRDNRDKDKDNNSGNKGHPLNTQHSQKRPAESNNKNTNNNNNNNNGQSSGSSNKDVSCGTVVYNKAQPLVTYGQKTARGQWPWHVALYRTEGINLSYVCGGSLVSVNYVITAAHCVTKKPYDKPVDSDTLVIYLGKYHQHQFSDEGGVQNKQVKRVHIYPTFNSSNYLGDIALLQLSSDVDYSMYVRPVCLWDDSTAPLQLSAVEGRDGTVIGWGYDENDRVSEELKMAIMPIVSHQQCLWSNPQFFSQFTSDETFCAGFRNGTSVCNGDSGGGMVFKIDSAWYLRGIVSITVARDGLRVCDTKHYVVFTDVAKYLGWIRPILASGSR